MIPVWLFFKFVDKVAALALWSETIAILAILNYWFMQYNINNNCHILAAANINNSGPSWERVPDLFLRLLWQHTQSLIGNSIDF